MLSRIARSLAKPVWKQEEFFSLLGRTVWRRRLPQRRTVNPGEGCMLRCARLVPKGLSLTAILATLCLGVSYEVIVRK